MLKLFNTLGRKKESFTPQQGNVVTLYTCGPTVYDYAHIGNLRAFLFGDLLKRTLKLQGYSVQHVMNITDVGHLVGDGDTGEDKLQVGADRDHTTAWQVADFYLEAFLEDMKKLRIEAPTHLPRATDHIDEMILLIQTLEKKGFTYRTGDGVYFDTARLKDYGKLAKLNTKGLKAGARVEMGGKKNPTDFALWKFSPADVKRDMEWDSPWGRGFPGWHLECSALVMAYLGETIDIHCGGTDHIPVHHTNEIAQSEAATGKPLARFWLHNEFMLINGAKMSKSEGNYFTLKQLIEKSFSPLAFRYLCLSVHYRSQMNFTLDALRDAQNAVQGINDFVFRIRNYGTEGKESKVIGGALLAAKKKFLDALGDDLDTPHALAALFDLMKAVNKEIDAGSADKKSLAAVNGFLADVNTVLDIIDEQRHELSADEKKLIALREHFRLSKDFKAADEIRKQLQERGIVLEDTPQGPKWKKAMA